MVIQAARARAKLKARSQLSGQYREVEKKIQALEKAVLAFQPGLVGSVGRTGAEDTNRAIILAARLTAVWARIGKSMAVRR